MVFEVQRLEHGSAPQWGIKRTVSYDWTYRTKDGTAVARSAQTFGSEDMVRKDIAKAKISMRAARFAKVVVTEIPADDPPF